MAAHRNHHFAINISLARDELSEKRAAEASGMRAHLLALEIGAASRRRHQHQ